LPNLLRVRVPPTGGLWVALDEQPVPKLVPEGLLHSKGPDPIRMPAERGSKVGTVFAGSAFKLTAGKVQE